MKEMEKMKNRTLTNSALALAGAATLLSGCTIGQAIQDDHNLATHGNVTGGGRRG